MAPIVPPPQWGQDQLSAYSTVAFQNQFATFVHAPGWYALLSSIEALLSACTGRAMGGILHASEPIGRLLFHQAHSLYRAAALAAVSGHCLAAYPSGRSSLEAACYGWHILQDPTAAQRWESKPGRNDWAALKAWNGEFSVSGICKQLEQQAQATADWTRHLYQEAIDSGAHPNEQGIFGNMALERFDDGGMRVGMNYLHGWGPVFVAAAKFVAEIGMLAVRLYVLTMPVGAERDELQHNLDRSSRELSALSASDLALFKAAQ